MLIAQRLAQLVHGGHGLQVLGADGGVALPARQTGLQRAAQPPPPRHQHPQVRQVPARSCPFSCFVLAGMLVGVVSGAGNEEEFRLGHHRQQLADAAGPCGCRSSANFQANARECFDSSKVAHMRRRQMSTARWSCVRLMDRSSCLVCSLAGLSLAAAPPADQQAPSARGGMPPLQNLPHQDHRETVVATIEAAQHTLHAAFAAAGASGTDSMCTTGTYHRRWQGAGRGVAGGRSGCGLDMSVRCTPADSRH